MSGMAWGARGPSKVSVGFHNLSATAPGGYYKTNTDQICVFCHTPHGGSLDGPLWNRNNPSSAWKHYNSATLSTHLKGESANRAPNAVSMLCLSCHDGSLALNHVLNEPNVLEGAPILGPGGVADLQMVIMFGQNPNIIGSTALDEEATGDFTDDHPFSFSYDLVRGSTEYETGNAKDGTLKTVPEAISRGVRFFAGPTGTNNVECSSCHDPHVNYNSQLSGNSDYTPFLITPNTGSLLCLACHTK
jgi:hypothetical protein